MLTTKISEIFLLIFTTFILCFAQQPVPLPLLRIGSIGKLKLGPSLAEYSADSNQLPLVGVQSEIHNDSITTTEASVMSTKFVSSMKSRSNTKLECGVESSHDRIVGGENAELHEYPWLALLYYQNKESDPVRYKCGGTLINLRTIITAAHCVEGRMGELLKFVRLGEWDTSSDVDCVDEEECSDAPIDFVPEKIIVHPERSQVEKNNDIALIVLKNEVPYTDFIRPICLPVKNFEPEDIKSVAQALLVAGWGSTHEIVKNVATIKQKLKLNYFPFSDCSNLFKAENVNLSSNQIICAGGTRGKGACRGLFLI